jgi:hypothetical protein
VAAWVCSQRAETVGIEVVRGLLAAHCTSALRPRPACVAPAHAAAQEPGVQLASRPHTHSGTAPRPGTASSRRCQRSLHARKPRFTPHRNACIARPSPNPPPIQGSERALQQFRQEGRSSLTAKALCREPRTSSPPTHTSRCARCCTARSCSSSAGAAGLLRTPAAAATGRCCAPSLHTAAPLACR